MRISRVIVAHILKGKYSKILTKNRANSAFQLKLELGLRLSLAKINLGKDLLGEIPTGFPSQFQIQSIHIKYQIVQSYIFLCLAPLLAVKN